ncbi:DNA polymerase IV [Candidatus Thorarchaeota archaeon]|nr:MAG: DNA polymerase IV [Candidatus Thorarchaeota archaeon]
MHIDMDAFFASVEQYRHYPELVGQPVCVGHDPKKGRGRGVVRAASYEARRFGIKSGMPVSKAYKLCPDAIFVQGDFSSYTEASDEFMDVLRQYADGERVRRASIDEAYIETTDSCRTQEDAAKLARLIQKAVKEETSLPCSIGVAPNMTLAKIASDIEKPEGITVVGQGLEERAKFLAPLPLQAIPGIGPKTSERLGDHGIEKIRQLQAMTITELYPIMGKGSEWLLNRALGIDERSLIDNGPRIRKSISKDRTFMQDVDAENLDFLKSEIRSISARITRKLHEKKLWFRTVTLKLRYADYETIQRSRSLPIDTNDGIALEKTAISLLEEELDFARQLRLIGVKVSSLSRNELQMVLTEFI